MLMVVVRALVGMLTLMRMMVAVVVSVLMGEIAPVFMLVAAGGLSIMHAGREFAPTMSVVMSVLVVVVIAAVHACALVLVGMFALMRMGVIVVVPRIFSLLMLMRMGARSVAFKMAVQPRHVVVMVFQLSLKPHVEVAGAHAVLRHLAHDDLVPRERKTREHLAQVLLVGSQIEQGRDDHVAADARCTFEIEGLSHEVVLSRSEMTCH